MKIILSKVFLVIVFITQVYGAERKVLVEVFTNSHCPKCPPAHNAILAYKNNSTNNARMNFIFYHMIYPYSDDQLYQANPQDAAGRNSYYGPFTSTPVGFFDGQTQGSNYSSWGSGIDDRLSVESPFKIHLSGEKNSASFLLNTEIISMEQAIPQDLVLHIVIVEDVNYQGRNGIADHKNVMRKMLNGAKGDPVSIPANSTVNFEKNVELNTEWNTENLGIVVFIQSQSTREVFQSEFVYYRDLSITSDISDEPGIINSFELFQNYPNPFNPETKIRFSIAEQGQVSLKIFNVLGVQVADLVNDVLQSGLHEVTWNAKNYVSGIYLYTLKSRGNSYTRRMLLLK